MKEEALETREQSMSEESTHEEGHTRVSELFPRSLVTTPLLNLQVLHGRHFMKCTFLTSQQAMRSIQSSSCIQLCSSKGPCRCLESLLDSEVAADTPAIGAKQGTAGNPVAMLDLESMQASFFVGILLTTAQGKASMSICLLDALLSLSVPGILEGCSQPSVAPR